MSNTNEYHHLSFLPAVEGWEMPASLEAMARRLVASGKLRIATDHARNFVKFGTTDTDTTFSQRELNDSALAADTRAEIARHVPPARGAEGIGDAVEQLRLELKKGRGIEPDKELKVARILVQSAHPFVIQRLLECGADIFVSYSHNVAELMAMHFWDTVGTASGLQATEREGAAVYVSCGGDPLFEGEEKTYTTDGFPALARMVVIAGQELGHFSDLIHTRDGILGRYSTDITSASLKPSARVRGARRADMRMVEVLRRQTTMSGLALLLRAERGVDFYGKRLKFSPPWLFYQCWRLAAWIAFRVTARPYVGLKTYPSMRAGSALELFFEDMQFNLAPKADVYRRTDPVEEEAIACIEALARVPQQVHKWGYKAVLWAWPELTRIYYGTVIPGTGAALRQAPKSDKITVIQSVNICRRRLFHARPGYYP